MKDTKYVNDVEMQLCSVPDSEGLILEVGDKNEVYLEVRVDENNFQWVKFFSSKEHIAIKLTDVEKMIQLAKTEVVNTLWE